MSKIEKLKVKIRSNPAGIRFSEIEKLIVGLGFKRINARGSHQVYKKESQLLTVVKPHGGRKFCAVVDVKKVLEFLEKGQ